MTLHTLRLLAELGGGGLLSAAVLMAALPAAAAEKQKPDQGIEGTVVKLSGNFMPGPGPAPGGVRQPLAVPVHIFRGTIESFEKPDPEHPALVKIVRSDKKGHYRVPLPPGEYTVVAEIGGKLYLNLYRADAATGKMVWATVTVPKGKWVAWNIEDTSDAAF